MDLLQELIAYFSNQQKPGEHLKSLIAISKIKIDTAGIDYNLPVRELITAFYAKFLQDDDNNEKFLKEFLKVCESQLPSAHNPEILVKDNLRRSGINEKAFVGMDMHHTIKEVNKMNMYRIFLKQISEEVGIKGSENQKFVFLERFHPANREKKNVEVQNLIQQNEHIKYTNLNQDLKEVIKKIYNCYQKKIVKDGVTIPPTKQGRPPSNESPWEEIYKWLLEKEFPRRGWDIAKKIAVDAKEQMLMKPLDEKEEEEEDHSRAGQFGLSRIPKIKLDNEIETETIYRLQVNLQQNGYLLLINEDDDGDKYLVCPSKAFTKLNQLMSDQLVSIPEKEETEFGLEYMRKGEIYFLALITNKPLELSWVKTAEEDDLELNDERLNEIFKQIAMEGNSQVFTKSFMVKQKTL